jgi:hypothetical protein
MYAAAVKIRSLDPRLRLGQSRRALIRVNSVLARANNRAISLAVLGKRVGATTVECCGQRIMITCGMSGGLSSSTTMRSLPLILPAASALLGDDVVTAGSIPSRARFGVRTPWRARLIGSRKPGLEVIAKVRLAQCLQPDPALPIPPHPLPTNGWTCRINAGGLPEWIPPRWIDQDQRPHISARIQRIHTQQQLHRRNQQRRRPTAA